MSKRVRRRRGTDVELASFVGVEGEITVDTVNNNLRVHDGQTAGGHQTAKEEDVLRRDHNNWTASAEPIENNDETEGYVVGSRWYYADGSPYVEWVCIDAGEGSAEWVPTQERIQIEESFDIGGANSDFNVGSFVTCFRRGNSIQITGHGLFNHTESAFPQSDFISVPSPYRPTTTAGIDRLYEMTNTTIFRQWITNDGRIGTSYRSVDDGSIVERTNTRGTINLSFIVT